jgi:hypothetical protein
VYSTSMYSLRLTHLPSYKWLLGGLMLVQVMSWESGSPATGWDEVMSPAESHSLCTCDLGIDDIHCTLTSYLCNKG